MHLQRNAKIKGHRGSFLSIDAYVHIQDKICQLKTGITKILWQQLIGTAPLTHVSPAGPLGFSTKVTAGPGFTLAWGIAERKPGACLDSSLCQLLPPGKDPGRPYFQHKPCVGFWWSRPKASSCLQDPSQPWLTPQHTATEFHPEVCAGCRQSLLCLTGSCDISAACRPQVTPPALHLSAACRLEVSQQNFSHLCTRFGRAEFKLASCYLQLFFFFKRERERKRSVHKALHAKCFVGLRSGRELQIDSVLHRLPKSCLRHKFMLRPQYRLS